MTNSGVKTGSAHNNVVLPMTLFLLMTSLIRNSGFCNLKPMPSRSVFMNLTLSFVTSIPFSLATAVTFPDHKDTDINHISSDHISFLVTLRQISMVVIHRAFFHQFKAALYLRNA